MNDLGIKVRAGLHTGECELARGRHRWNSRAYRGSRCLPRRSRRGVRVEHGERPRRRIRHPVRGARLARTQRASRTSGASLRSGEEEDGSRRQTPRGSACWCGSTGTCRWTRTAGYSTTRRIEATLPTIGYLREQRREGDLVSHLGRPKGPGPKLSLRPMAERLAS